jgi:hypothetical protein
VDPLIFSNLFPSSQLVIQVIPDFLVGNMAPTMVQAATLSLLITISVCDALLSWSDPGYLTNSIYFTVRLP